MSGHSLQILNEFAPVKTSEVMVLQVSDTKYLNFTPLSMWDTVHGIWFRIEASAVTTGAGVLTCQFEGSTDPLFSNITNVSASFTSAAGGTVVVTEKMIAPNVIAAASPFATLLPFLRIKFTTPNDTKAAILKVTRTVRGLT
jgi:hypothetical protein